MADVMNTWINDSSGSWGSAETIKYDSSNLINIKLDLYSAVFQLEEVKTQIEIMESYEAQWQGEAKQTYLDLKNILTEYKEKKFDLEWKYKSKIKSLEKENNHLHRVIDKFKESIGKFIEWICQKFDMGAEDNLIRKFEKETRTYLDAEKQIAKEDREKELDLEI